MAAHVVCPGARDAIAIQTHNISCSGVLCVVPHYIPPSTLMKIAIILPLREAGGIHNHLLEFGGLVVRTEPEEEEPGRKEYRVAIYFHGLRGEARTLIETYVRQHSKDKPPA